jgi:Tfp pilus assembly protein PilN
MIKINLLPKTLNEKLALRNTAILFGVVLLVLVTGGVGYSFRLQGQVQKMEADATAAEQYEARVKAIQDQTAQLLASVQPIQAKLDFINNVLKYNLEYPKLYEQVARWTYEKAVLDSLQSDGSIVTLKGRVKSLDDLGRYLLNMYFATDLYTEVRITQAAGFGSKSEGSDTGGPSPFMGREISGSHATQAGIEAITSSMAQKAPGQASWISFTAVCKLKTPISAPAPPGGAAPSPDGAPPAPGPEAPMAPQSGPGEVQRMPDGDINPMGG